MKPLRGNQPTRLIVLALLIVMVVSACGGTAGPTGPLGEGRSVYSARCSACHGSSGQGGIGPGFGEVAETFPMCTDQIRWITLGSEKWKAEVGPVYGASDKPIDKVMPSFGEMLTQEEIASVAAFERSQYGDVEPDVALEQCGFDTSSGTSTP